MRVLHLTLHITLLLPRILENQDPYHQTRNKDVSLCFPLKKKKQKSFSHRFMRRARLRGPWKRKAAFHCSIPLSFAPSLSPTLLLCVYLRLQKEKKKQLHTGGNPPTQEGTLK